ncbi:hypothetical protein CPS_1782 [Colwellia psychrerythraea 34H]|uniref:Uncharacterized protein n=1 Tax=Colwellia psychrerythraea (strain 34H / ATCC BAA-681) TaxID=167879 RepID=Q484K2_COLP3|nr:hypothetical protein CPS_1782 [Colwellia psychrerythraea 34H]
MWGYSDFLMGNNYCTCKKYVKYKALFISAFLII